MPTMGCTRCRLPVEPKKGASPYANTPPSEPTDQYPPLSAVGVMATMGWVSGSVPGAPKYGAEPKVQMLPAALASQKLVGVALPSMPARSTEGQVAAAAGGAEGAPARTATAVVDRLESRAAPASATRR